MQTKQQIAERKRRWYLKNRKAILLRQKKYRVRAWNGEVVKKYNKEYWEKNKSHLVPRMRKRLRAYYSNPVNRAKKQKLSREWYRNNKNKVREYHREYRKNNSAVRVAQTQRRRVRYSGNVTANQILLVLLAQSGACFYCGKKCRLSVDHVLPLSKGGKHAASNIVMACTSCNSIKHTKLVTEFIDYCKLIRYKIKPRAQITKAINSLKTRKNIPLRRTGKGEKKPTAPVLV